jgi:transcriptional repressor NrdR
MFCPSCGDENTKVIDSRPDLLGRARQRRCMACGQRFSTVERVNIEDLMVRKRDGSLEPFSRGKLVRGVTRAAHLYALSPADINALIDRVVQKLQPGGQWLPIRSDEIGRSVLQELQDSPSITDVAQIRYALVFLGRTTWASRDFQGLRDFLDWLHDTYGPLATTYPPDTPWRVVKRDGRTEPFQLTKLEHSIRVLLRGRGTEREINDRAAAIAHQVAQELHGQALVTAQQIASEILKPLRKVDAMAYLRYASVAKRYRSVDDFWIEAHALTNEIDEVTSVFERGNE